MNNDLFSLHGQVAVVTGGSGVLGRAMAHGLAQGGARVVVIGRRADACEQVVGAIRQDGGEALGLSCDVQDEAALLNAVEQIEKVFGPVDILVNGAGGNAPGATTSPTVPFFDLDNESIDQVFRTNFTSALQSCRIFGREMAKRQQGCIINIASMSALRPLTRVVAYSAAKAALVNFTQWLAIHIAQEFSPAIRVNAISPGFFMTEQNRFLLTDAESGALTPRGAAIIAHTPAGRFGRPDDLVGALRWLVSPSATFVTGIVVPIDGGFSAFSGV